MDFQGSIRGARSQTATAIAELDLVDRSTGPDTAGNRAHIDRAVHLISPGATRAGADALDASRWDRWVTIRQIRDTGAALELLDSAWWSLTGRGGAQPDVDGARRTLVEAVGYLDRASSGGRWASPLVA